VVTGLAPWCNGASLADFTKCISPSGVGSVCQLDAGTYQLETRLHIARSNITVKGTITKSLADTTLRRAPGSTEPLLNLGFDQSPNLTSITVRDFTFDGGGFQSNGDSIDSEVLITSVKSLLVTNCTAPS
jgi:hypothetical protein